MLFSPSLAPADSAAWFGIDATIFPALAALALLILAGVLLAGFVMAVRVEAPRIESHWGGFGGSGGGWRMSASMAYLLAAIAFGAMFTALVKALPGAQTRASEKSASAPVTQSAVHDSVQAPPTATK